MGEPASTSVKAEGETNFKNTLSPVKNQSITDPSQTSQSPTRHKPVNHQAANLQSLARRNKLKHQRGTNLSICQSQTCRTRHKPSRSPTTIQSITDHLRTSRSPMTDLSITDQSRASRSPTRFSPLAALTEPQSSLPGRCPSRARLVLSNQRFTKAEGKNRGADRGNAVRLNEKRWSGKHGGCD